MGSPESKRPVKIISRLGLSILALSSIATACKPANATQIPQASSPTLSEIITNPCAFVGQKVTVAGDLEYVGTDSFSTYGFALDIDTGQYTAGLNSTIITAYRLHTAVLPAGSSLTAFSKVESTLRAGGVPMGIKEVAHQSPAQVIIQGQIEKVNIAGQNQCALKLTKVER